MSSLPTLILALLASFSFVQDVALATLSLESVTSHPSGVMTLKLSDLAKLDEFVNKAQTPVGVIVVTGDLPKEYGDALIKMREMGPECLGSMKAQPLSSSWNGQSSVHSRRMDDETLRTTFATESKAWESHPCFDVSPIAKVFDDIHQQFAIGLERLVDARQEALQWVSHSEQSLEESLGGLNHINSPYKDQFHIYERRMNKESHSKRMMVPFHLDNGLYLLLTPGEPSLQVQVC